MNGSQLIDREHEYPEGIEDFSPLKMEYGSASDVDALRFKGFELLEMLSFIAIKKAG